MAPSPGKEWTDDERSHIGRLETLCRSIDHWEMDCGFTDACDPWCVIYDRDEHRIVLHIARIDRRYVVVCRYASVRLTRSRWKRQLILPSLNSSQIRANRL